MTNLPALAGIRTFSPYLPNPPALAGGCSVNKLVEYAESGEIKEHEILGDNNVKHVFKFINGVPLNKEHSDLLVNFLEYWEIRPDNKILHFTWITDIPLSSDNVFMVMRGGRSRWKVENETFNTLKNQGYNFKHNYGHGKKNLTTILMLLMMLAFLVDQTLELSCDLFQQARNVRVSRINLWERTRALFRDFLIDDWTDMYTALIRGPPAINIYKKLAQGP